MAKKSIKLKKIIWAVDVFSNEKLQLNVAAFLSLVMKKIKVEVGPVFILSTSAFPYVVDKQGIMVYLPDAEERFGQLSEQSGIHDLKPNKILVQPKGGLIRNDVKAILNYAHTTKSQTIVVGTHAKTGVAILFVTDFSSESRIAFKSVLIFAQQLKAKIILFHLHEGENEIVGTNVLFPKGTKWIPAGVELLRKSLLFSRKKALTWEKFAEDYEVPCSSQFDYGFKNIADAAIEMSTKLKIDMITIASKKSPVASTFVGSTTRWLVRSAHCPVWVLHVEK